VPGRHLSWAAALAGPPGKEAFGTLRLGEARAGQLVLDHVPRGAVAVAYDLLFADELLAFSDAVQVAGTECLVVGLENL
jgi:hypothetical protein